MASQQRTAAKGARVVLEGLGKRYGPVTALAPTDLEIEPGEFFSLLGPSGSGKTTLLGCVAGFAPPTSGRLLVNGRELVSVPPYRRNIGMVFQHYSLFPHMSVFDNIAFPLRMRGLAAAEIADRVERMLRTVRLPGFADRRPGQLSGGQQQRIALVRAAVYDPPLLLMDEPLGALDKNLREEMQYEIKRFHEQVGATVIYVTHDQDEAATMSDRIAILNKARIVQVGPPRELYEHPSNTFVASFLGEANLFPVTSVTRVSADVVQVETVTGVPMVAEAPAENANGLVACVRPENIAIVDRADGAANQARGRVTDVVYTAGTIRYQVMIGEDARVTVRQPSQRRKGVLSPGTEVLLTWQKSDTVLVAEDRSSITGE